MLLILGAGLLLPYPFLWIIAGSFKPEPRDHRFSRSGPSGKSVSRRTRAVFTKIRSSPRMINSLIVALSVTHRWCLRLDGRVCARKNLSSLGRGALYF